MNNDVPAYGNWEAVVAGSLFILIFALSFFAPKSRRDWRTFGTFSAFVIALFTEMYGFPLTIYLLSGWLTKRYPNIDWFSHDSGHLLGTLLGAQGDAHFNLLHLLSNIFIWGGIILLGASWRVLFRAQQSHELAVDGPYSSIRHPQYAAFILTMFGFLIMWPTLPTLIMFPILVTVYVRLAKREEQEVQQAFGELYSCYATRTPRFWPRFTPIDDASPIIPGD